LVEQKTENLCVPGSIPGSATSKIRPLGSISNFPYDVSVYSCVIAQKFDADRRFT
jgi:hypothetical protein